MRVTLFLLALLVAAKPPNVLFILMDDMGRQDLSVYGSSLCETPHIDSLARDGAMFSNAYVAFPRCVPSRMAYMSGQYPTRFGQPGFPVEKDNALPIGAVTFAEHFQRAGYTTGYIGKWHLGHHEPGFPENRGFDKGIVAGAAGAPNSYFYPYDKTRKGTGKEGFPEDFLGKDGDYLTDHLTYRAEAFMERNKEEPFLLVMAHYAVHTPIEAKENHIKRFQRRLEKQGIKPAVSGQEIYDAKADSWGEQKTLQNNPVYAGMVFAADKSVGRLLAKLEALGLTEDTIVIFSSDHGGLSSRGRTRARELATSNLPFRHGKGWCYEGGLRVPLLVKWPAKIKTGTRSDALVNATDHFPTMLQLAGLPLAPEDHKDGFSYVRALRGAAYTRPAPMFWHEPTARPTSTGEHNYSCVRQGDWKLIHWFDDKVYELYNIADDPGETKNRVAENPEKTAALQKTLLTWKQSVNAREKKKRK